MATVTVNGLEYGRNYTIVAGGTLNGALVGPRSIHGSITKVTMMGECTTTEILI